MLHIVLMDLPSFFVVVFLVSVQMETDSLFGIEKYFYMNLASDLY